MLSNARRPLLSAATSSRTCIAPASFVVQTRLASEARPKQAIKTNNGPAKKKREKPRRDKVAASFLPLPASQIAAFQNDKSPLLELPRLESGKYPSGFVGKAVRFPVLEGNMMKTFGLPRNMLVDFRLLSTPCSVSRKVTASLIERLDLAAGNSSKDDRLILTGPSGCGKSYLMLQAVSYCSINDWIVLYIPRGQKLVDSSTSYFYDPRTQLYLQPVASSQILQRLLIVNRRIIEQLKVTQTVTFEKHDSVITGAPLKDLIEIAVSEQHLAPTILSAVLTELGKQKMYPVLLAIDEFQTLYCKTSYRDQHYNTIRSFHLSLPRLLMEYASGKKVFSRGAVLGALSPTLTNYPLPPELQKVITPDNLPNPYTKLVPGLVEYSQGLETFPVPEKLDYNEAAALFEIWKKDSSFHTTVTDEFFLSKYTESSGNARDFVHRGLLATLIT